MNILKFLDEKKLTQQELGDAIGTSNQNVNRWVTGKGVPSYEFCKKLIELGMTIEDLFDIQYNDMHNLVTDDDSELIGKDDFDRRVTDLIDDYMRRLNDKGISLGMMGEKFKRMGKLVDEAVESPQGK